MKTIRNTGLDCRTVHHLGMIEAEAHMAPIRVVSTRETLTVARMLAKQREKRACWYDEQAAELRATGDADLNTLACEYEQFAAYLRGAE